MDVDFPDDFPDFVLNFTRIHPLTSPLSLLGCLKVELSLVAMKAGCPRPGPLPPPVASAAPVVVYGRAGQ
jgi:hypothetical protein